MSKQSEMIYVKIAENDDKRQKQCQKIEVYVQIK